MINLQLIINSSGSDRMRKERYMLFNDYHTTRKSYRIPQLIFNYLLIIIASCGKNFIRMNGCKRYKVDNDMKSLNVGT